jgi:serine/threonine protein phosphatase 1
MKSRSFVIPDIHGCARTFKTLLHKVLMLRPDDNLYLLGDYIDRGPRSKELLDEIIRLRRSGYSVHTLRGNHEVMLLQSRESLSALRLWLINGGQATLESFGAEDPGEIPYGYRNFLLGLNSHIILDNFVLVHACLNFEIPDPYADTEAMLWARTCNVNPERIGGRRIICGHTAISRDSVEESLTTNRIMLDNGCVYKDSPGLGSLTALELNSMKLYYQKNID